MPVGDSRLDPLLLSTATELEGRALDPERTVCLLDAEEAGIAIALAGLVNGRGGHLLVGVKQAPDGGAVLAVPGVALEVAEQRLRGATARLDPSVDELVQARSLPAGDGRVLFVLQVRQSPRPPHLDAETAQIYLGGERGIGPVRSRAALDGLYSKGKAERERAERLIEGTIERLMLAHYAFYGLGVVACLQQPGADPYLWAREHPDELADSRDRFILDWGFTPEMVRVRPGEAELRNEREVCGLIRVARTGCVAVGETRRKPAGDVLGPPAELNERIGIMVDAACRVLAHAPRPRIVPRLFCEGLRSMRLITSRQPYDESAPAPLDMLQSPGATGDPTDPAYRRDLTNLFTQRLCALFEVDCPPDGDAQPS